MPAKKYTPIQESKLMGAFLTEARQTKTERGLSVSLGQLPGFPNRTSDPAVVREAAEKMEVNASEATSPVRELRLRQRVLDMRMLADELEEVQAAGESEARVWFMAHGARWAEDNDITYAAFRQMGVSAADLKEAGIH